jgi:ABC-type nitrate/sulfonate/bicarbonate transport system ATPase subunit
VLELVEVCHEFAGDVGVPVLDRVSLTVRDGDFVSIVGPSGCGKSTLLRILAGLVEPSAGRVVVEGTTLAAAPGHAAFMPQHDRLLDWRRALDNAALAADVHGADRTDSRRRAAELFERFGLAGFERAWPSELSGGMRQRLALLRTFLADRELLLLDEPFGALDAITRRGMHTWLQEVLAHDRRSVLFVTHDVDEALVLSDRVVVLSGRPGRVVAVHAVDAPRPRAPTVVTEPWFVAQKAALLADLEAGVR